VGGLESLELWLEERFCGGPWYWSCFFIPGSSNGALSSIGFLRLRIGDVLTAIAAGILMVVGIVAVYSVVFPALHLQMNTSAMQKLLLTILYLWRRTLRGNIIAHWMPTASDS
jgi:hypothetical protein